jgi:hypothetical protein
MRLFSSVGCTYPINCNATSVRLDYTNPYPFLKTHNTAIWETYLENIRRWVCFSGFVFVGPEGAPPRSAACAQYGKAFEDVPGTGYHRQCVCHPFRKIHGGRVGNEKIDLSQPNSIRRQRTVTSTSPWISTTITNHYWIEASGYEWIESKTEPVIWIPGRSTSIV